MVRQRVPLGSASTTHRQHPAPPGVGSSKWMSRRCSVFNAHHHRRIDARQRGRRAPETSGPRRPQAQSSCRLGVPGRIVNVSSVLLFQRRTWTSGIQGWRRVEVRAWTMRRGCHTRPAGSPCRLAAHDRRAQRQQRPRTPSARCRGALGAFTYAFVSACRALLTPAGPGIRGFADRPAAAIRRQVGRQGSSMLMKSRAYHRQLATRTCRPLADLQPTKNDADPAEPEITSR